MVIETSAETRWIKVRLYPIINSNGDILKVVNIAEDITERKQAEVALKESEADFRNLIEQNPQLIEVYKPNGQLINYNNTYRSLLGFNDETIQWMYDNYNILDDEAALSKELMPGINKVFSGEQVNFDEYEFDIDAIQKSLHLSFQNKGKIWVKSTGFPIKNELGNITQVVFISTDVSQQYKAERELRESEEYFRDLIEQNPLFVEIYSPDGKLIHLNTTYKNLLDINEELTQILYGNYNLLEDEYAIENGLGPGIKNVFAGEYFEFNEYEFDIDLVRSWLQLENKNKGKLWFKATGFPIKDENGAIKQVVILSQDVSSRVTAEQGLIESEHKFRALFNTGGYAMGLSKMSDRRVKMVNQAWLALYGYSSEIEAIGSLVTDIIVLEERKNIKDNSTPKTDRRCSTLKSYHN